MKHFNTVDDAVLALFRSISGNDNYVNEATRIISLYLKPPRYYHTIEHVWNMLGKLSEFEGKFDQTRMLAAKLATVFHDVIYDCKWKNAETVEVASAKVWISSVQRMESTLDIETIMYVYDLIISTQNHIPEDEHLETFAFLDADMSILGSDRETYMEYAGKIRKEWMHIPDQMYLEGRLKFLTKILEKSCIFYTEYGKHRWELQARKNMMYELKLLSN